MFLGQRQWCIWTTVVVLERREGCDILYLYDAEQYFDKTSRHQCFGSAGTHYIYSTTCNPAWSPPASRGIPRLCPLQGGWKFSLFRLYTNFRWGNRTLGGLLREEIWFICTVEYSKWVISSAHSGSCLCGKPDDSERERKEVIFFSS